jgi:hypothetical protein
MKSLINFFNAVRASFESPNLPMDSDYNYLARQREAERIRTAHQFRLM